jgi:putative acetyltransferase
MIAYCGLDCEKCDAFIATKNNDQVLREKTAKLWSELNHTTILPEQINCTGCRADGPKTVYCEELCTIRQCAMKKGFTTCGDCADMEKCPTLGMITANNPDALKNLGTASYENIRPATPEDSERIAEIEVFNYRLNFYPIFRNDDFYFKELSVSALTADYQTQTDTFWVYDDGVVKGFVQISGKQIKKLFVEPVLHSNKIGQKLLDFAVNTLHADFLWVLEKNARAISFYERSGFRLTQDKKFEEGTTEFLAMMKLLENL